MTSRNYVFTLNNYTEEELTFWKSANEWCQKIKYSIIGLEVGESGTPHLQGYMCLSNSLSMTAVHKLAPACRRLHLEIRRGSAEQARDYCMKGTQSHEEWAREGSDGAHFGFKAVYFESGDWKACQQGARMDLEAAKDDLRSGMRFQDFLEQHSGVASRCMRFFEKFYQGVQKNLAKEFREVDVTVLYGAPGSGKTRAVFEMFPSAFNVDCSVAFPFDGYDGEDVIVLNDFKGNLQRKTFLETLEGYPQKVNIKNGHTWARWTKVFITSNYAPWDWYKEYTWAEGRRLSSVLKFEAPEQADETISESVDISEDQLKQFISTLENVPRELASSLTDLPVVSGSLPVAGPPLVEVAEGNSEPQPPALTKSVRLSAMEKAIARLCEGTFATVRVVPKIVPKMFAEPHKHVSELGIVEKVWAGLPRSFTG